MQPAPPTVLILNAGSSSIKWSVLDAAEHEITAGDRPWSQQDPGGHTAEIRALIRDLPPFDAVAHRVVHGGAAFHRAVLVDQRVRDTIADLVELAPLHNPAALAGIDAVTTTFPSMPQVATFDTAFHATIPEAAALYALPWDWSERWQLRRYGFHGLSVAYAVGRATQLLGRLPSRAVVCHLGAGCSVTAVAEGRSIDTSMGFTPLEGVMMARRSGSVDPGLLLHVLQRQSMSPAELDHALNERSGLLGVSGISVDLRAVRAAADGGNSRAALACAMFTYGVVRVAGSMIAALGGLDALIFTGGIGEHAAWVRHAVGTALAFTGLRLDEAANETVKPDADIAAPGSTARCLVITAREDLAMLREALPLLAGSNPASQQ